MMARTLSKHRLLPLVVLTGATSFSPLIWAYSPAGSNPAFGYTGLTVFGQFFPCATTLSIGVGLTGSATVTGAGFAPGSSACLSITSNTAWTFDPAVPVRAGVYQAVIRNISVTVRLNSTMTVTCIGNVTATLDQNITPHRLTIVGTLLTSTPISNQPCAFTTTGLQPYFSTSLTAP